MAELSMPEQANHSHHYCQAGTKVCPISAFEASIPAFELDAHSQTFFTTNEPPDVAALPTLLSGLAILRSIYANIDERITAMHVVLEQMQKAKAAAALTVKQYEGATHPIRSIPDDILLSIFEWCTFVRQPHIDYLSSKTTPWTIARVSSRWRALALASPRLWSLVDIYSNHDRPTGLKLHRLALTIDRSKDCDLSVKIWHNHPQDTFLEECFRLLEPTTDRWRWADLMLYSTFLTPLMGRTLRRLTQAHIFLLYNNRTNSTYLDMDTAFKFWHTPNLTRLSLPSSTSMRLSLDNITWYSCNERALQYLPKLTSLEHLSLSSIRMGSSEPEMKDDLGASFPLTMPTVRSLSVAHAVGSIQEFSELLVLPSLITLALSFETFRPPFPTFRGSIRHLQNLSICIRTASGRFDNATTHNKFLSFLAECTSVTAIYLGAHIADVATLNELQSFAMLPKLTSLRIDAQVMRVHPGCLIDLVESRCSWEGQSARLTELRIVEEETQRKARWTELEIATEELLERWEVLRTKVNVLDVYENLF